MRRVARGRAGLDGGEAVAGHVHRLAVLLEAGLPAIRAWREVIADDPRSGTERADTTRAADEAGDGADAARGDLAVVLVRRGGVWSDVAVAWKVASTVGAPLAPSLRGIAEALRDAEGARDDVAIALAEPASTARLIAWLPLLALALVAAFGFDVVATLASPFGLVCLLAGAGLIFAAHRWTAALVRRAQPPSRIAGWECDLVAVALTGGVSIDRALAVVTEAGCPTAVDATSDVLALSRSCGAPAVELLRAEAADRRRTARTEGRLRAARLASRLLVPLGVCTLPAFLLLGVAPMLLAVVGSAPLLL
jgi:tight adherence protein B